MTLIKSISGIRGTIGGAPGEGLTPLDVVKFSAAYAKWLEQNTSVKNKKVVIGRDARVSGPMVVQLIEGTLIGMGVNVVNIGLASTPTTEMAVINEAAQGGIIVTASHNPFQWNALKLLNDKGEFLSAGDGEKILKIADSNSFQFADVHNLGTVKVKENYDDHHIDKILKLDLVDVDAISKARFKVAIDCVNSVGGIILPKLLIALGVEEVLELNVEPDGHFPHNPEPLPENLTDLSALIKDQKADIGFVVDPDVDRLALVCEDGSMFGEEYTLVAVADYILGSIPGNTVSNLSSTRALRDVTARHGGKYAASAVGEVNVVEKMKETGAVIGGEGNGGVIYPELHYGRDALVGVALFLTYLAKQNKTLTELKATFPYYHISKNKIELPQNVDVDEVLLKLKDKFATEKVTDIDGVKIDFEKKWVHLRKSNTEPIIRIYSEAETEKAANELAMKFIGEIKTLL
ncbi:phosphoglucosamine mutase [Saccharicrinis sp. FJH62]|uniref:phosphoglucosamine mutase n=1 Tax=Saccharicrinis sp. FJH62 TaxID=3344657 RepID=UPI0035D40D5E